MLRELQALYNDPKMLQYAPGGLLPKMGAGRVDPKGQGIRHGRVAEEYRRYSLEEQIHRKVYLKIYLIRRRRLLMQVSNPARAS